VRIFRSFPPHIHSHSLYLSLVLSWTIILFSHCKSNATPVVFRFGLESVAISTHGSATAWYAAPSRGVAGALACAGDSLCTKTPARSLNFLFLSGLLRVYVLHWTRFSFASAQSSLHFLRAAGFVARIIFPSLDSPVCYIQLPAAIIIFTLLAVHFLSILALMPFYSAHCGDPVLLYDNCALSGACDHRARDVVGRKREGGKSTRCCFV
jgi:hypothetical protein